MKTTNLCTHCQLPSIDTPIDTLCRYTYRELLSNQMAWDRIGLVCLRVFARSGRQWSAHSPDATAENMEDGGTVQRMRLAFREQESFGLM